MKVFLWKVFELNDALHEVRALFEGVNNIFFKRSTLLNINIYELVLASSKQFLVICFCGQCQ